MKRLFAVLLLASIHSLAAADDFSEWEDLGNSKDVALSERKNEKTGFSEYRAAGVVDAPVEVVRKILSDVDESTEFMPYVIEVKVLKRKSGEVTFYQRIKPPFVTDRDYTLRLVESMMKTPNGSGYRLAWRTANEDGPAEKDGVVRVPLNIGFWELKPTADGARTDLTYSVYTSIGKSVPAFLLKKGNKIALPKIIEAVRKRAAEMAK